MTLEQNKKEIAIRLNSVVDFIQNKRTFTAYIRGLLDETQFKLTNSNVFLDEKGALVVFEIQYI